MSIRFLLCFFLLGGALCCARADVIISGNVILSGTKSCSDSGTPPTSIHLVCNSTNGTFGSVMGSVNPFSGDLHVDAETPPFTPPARTLCGIALSEIYLVTGGVGPTTIDIALQSDAALGNKGTFNCNLTFDGVSESCLQELFAGISIISKQVIFDVPFSIGLDLSIFATAPGGTMGIATNGDLSYGISGPHLAVVTPEPSSIYLLIPGLVGTLVSFRRKGISA